MKICSKCKVEKSFSEFNKGKGTHGLHAYCRPCNRAVSAAWVAANLEKNRERAREWGRSNTELNRARASAWVVNNPERAREQRRNWKQNNPEKVLSTTQTRRARKAQNGVYKIPARFMQKLYASPCFYCGSTQSIQADHVIPIARGGVHSMGNLVPACKSCNSGKCDKTITEWRMATKGALQQ